MTPAGVKAATPHRVAAPAPTHDDYGHPLDPCATCREVGQVLDGDCLDCDGHGYVLAPELEPEEL